MAEITERDTEVAYALVSGMFRRLGIGIQDMAAAYVMASEALANHAAEARREENRACEKELRAWEVNPDFGDVIKALAERIAARRGGHG